MGKVLTRREILAMALASPVLSAAPGIAGGQDRKANELTRHSFIYGTGSVVPVGDPRSIEQVRLSQRWKGPICSSRLINEGAGSVRVKEVVLFDLTLPLPADTRLYGEGFQMLTQTGGTLGQPTDLGNYTDAKHYKLPAPEGAKVFYGLLTLAETTGKNHLLAFTSCRRFSGQFYLDGSRLKVVADTEGLELKSGESWQLEEFMFQSGPNREQLLADLGQRLQANHPRLQFAAPPAGWCSWYCFGPRVTAQQVLDNLDFIARQSP
ncbi:MAG: hypothetical protein ND895_02100, partial [Pyrinomonadaceae bacterium]|nr:hypothetical protein [Pyrinomonadaceae bacterium]